MEIGKHIRVLTKYTTKLDIWHEVAELTDNKINNSIRNMVSDNLYSLVVRSIDSRQWI